MKKSKNEKCSLVQQELPLEQEKYINPFWAYLLGVSFHI